MGGLHQSSDEVTSAADAELVEHDFEVVLHGVLADPQLCCDLSRGLSAKTSPATRRCAGVSPCAARSSDARWALSTLRRLIATVPASPASRRRVASSATSSPLTAERRALGVGPPTGDTSSAANRRASARSGSGTRPPIAMSWKPSLESQYPRGASECGDAVIGDDHQSRGMAVIALLVGHARRRHGAADGSADVRGEQAAQRGELSLIEADRAGTVQTQEPPRGAVDAQRHSRLVTEAAPGFLRSDAVLALRRRSSR